MILKQIVDSKGALERLGLNSLPIKAAWDLKKFIKKVNPELDTFYEIRNKTIVELGEPETNEAGVATGETKVKSENLIEFGEKMKVLLEQDVDVDIPNIALEDLKEVNISIADLMSLEWLIKEE